MNRQNVRVLIIQEDEGEYQRTQTMLAGSELTTFAVDWAATYHAGLAALRSDASDIALVDERLGIHSGLDLIREARAAGCGTLIIMLTSEADSAFDDEALAAGATDYLEKAGLTEATLRRSIRYAFESRRTEEGRNASEKSLGKAMAELRQSHEELKATQLILIQTEKMESLGRLAGGIAHEVKNPLSQIMLAADFLMEALQHRDANVDMVIEDIRRAVSRVDNIVRGLLDFSTAKGLNLRAQDINAVVRQSLVLMNSVLLAAHVKVETMLGEGLPPVEVDQQKIEQVLMNLFTNAIHAMPKGGAIRVKTFLHQLSDAERDEGAKLNVRLRAGDTVVVTEISDGGHGIPPEKLGVIFDPFFTTKPSGKGTGLGLTVSRKIVDLHGGRLEIGNLAEGGVRAAITLLAQTAEFAENRDVCQAPIPLKV